MVRGAAIQALVGDAENGGGVAVVGGPGFGGGAENGAMGGVIQNGAGGADDAAMRRCMGLARASEGRGLNAVRALHYP